ncbi:hypothetical protein [Microlunatus ginsengisoli]|uniref:WXG100 family type VII secretion target n=1 Tax=Microlunatus ginsengisoli TaxID=363863 RepID=A0ABP7AMT1_9ACTN
MNAHTAGPGPATPNQVARLLIQATAAADNMRGIVHDTHARNAIPAAELDPILVPLEDLANGLDQALRQLAGSLTNSLAIWDLRDDAWDTHPATSVSQACDQLDDAATHAWHASRNLAAARAITAGTAGAEAGR